MLSFAPASEVPRLRRAAFLLWLRAGAEEQLRAMAAAGSLRGLAVAGGGESSDSEDDGWDIGYLDRSSQVMEEVTTRGPLIWASPGL